MKKTLEEKVEFYLDPTEMSNKPKRIFMGLAYKLDLMIRDNKVQFQPGEEDLIREMIKEAEKDFYKYTMPKFKERYDSI